VIDRHHPARAPLQDAPWPVSRTALPLLLVFPSPLRSLTGHPAEHAHPERACRTRRAEESFPLFATSHSLARRSFSGGGPLLFPVFSVRSPSDLLPFLPLPQFVPKKPQGVPPPACPDSRRDPRNASPHMTIRPISQFPTILIPHPDFLPLGVRFPLNAAEEQ
jgi:hypothetical protein